jgi:5-methylcytosine-specific restriction endonuclease McrA
MSDGRFKKGIRPWNTGLKPTQICGSCGKKFQASPNKRAAVRYCSNHCKNKKSPSRFQKGVAVWNKNKPNEKIRGDRHYNWKGGISERPDLNRTEWNELKKICYKNFNWSCFKCGKKIHKKGEIQAHHLIPRRLGGPDEISNLITLCQSCHIKIEKIIWKRLAEMKGHLLCKHPTNENGKND